MTRSTSRSRWPRPEPWRLLALLLALPAAAQDAAGWTARVEAAGDASALTEALVGRGEARRLAGDATRALEDLRRAAATAPSDPERAFALAALGAAEREGGAARAATATLTEALALAGGQPGVEAVAAANLALARLADAPVETAAGRAARLAEAEAALARARAAAARAAIPAVTATVETAAARFETALDRPGGARRAVAAGLAALGDERGPVAGHARLALGDAALAAGDDAAAGRAYAEAAEGAEPRLGALAALGRAELALRRGAHGEAARLAAGVARTGAALGADDLLFAADWLTAEARAAAGDPEAAAAAYARAFDALRALRRAAPLGSTPPASARRFAPRRFQTDYVAFLLDEARRGGGEASARLGLARAVVEDLKIDEVEEYFQARCAPESRTRAAEALAPGVAVLYPVVFEDRAAMLYAIGEQVGLVDVPAGRDALRREIDALRYLIDAGTDALDPARRLYDLLIAPVAPALARAGVGTLVFAPDGPLRALPLAALWDGERRLVERYALATVLGLGLVDEGPFEPGGARALAAGSEAVPDYPPLPSVGRELEALAGAFPTETLANEDFETGRLAAELSEAPYDIVHIASHAEFGATPERNFVATEDGRFDMGRLEATLRARAVRTGRPLGLLTLSACSTAAGDERLALERAPLGLASVAFRSGARSVLASLWAADDRATADLMTAFYAELRAGTGRAEALRRAQLGLMRDPATASPFQWATFILIGDWR